MLYVVIAMASAASYCASSRTGQSWCDRTSTTAATPSRSALTATCRASWTVGQAYGDPGRAHPPRVLGDHQARQRLPCSGRQLKREVRGARVPGSVSPENIALVDQQARVRPGLPRQIAVQGLRGRGQRPGLAPFP